MQMIHRGIICLLKSAVTQSALTLPEDFSLEEAYPILSRQSLISLGYQGAVNCALPKNTPLMQKMMIQSYQHMMISERQLRAIDALFQSLENNGIDYMPLKGCNMKRLYPKADLRVMGDADILIRPEQHDKLRPIMESLGYTLKLESEHTDNWSNSDLYVELHKSVVPTEDEDYYAYYGTGWRIAVRGEGHRYDPSPEDTFLFLFTHFARHYRISGIGCRHVLDLYVYRNANPCLDEAYIRGELKKLGLLEFYQNMCRLLDVWFADGEPDEITELMTLYIFSGGNWGTMEASMYSEQLRQSAASGAVRGSFRKSALRTVFPPLSVIRNRYQILRKFPVLLPVMWIVRWIDVAIYSPRNLKRRISILWKLEDSTVLDHQKSLQAVGLDYTIQAKK